MTPEYTTEMRRVQDGKVTGPTETQYGLYQEEVLSRLASKIKSSLGQSLMLRIIDATGAGFQIIVFEAGENEEPVLDDTILE